MLEAGYYCTYGGDDEVYLKLVQNTLNDEEKNFTLKDFLSNRYSTYIYLSYFLILPFKSVGLQIDFPITLALFHSAVGSLIIPVYNAVFRKLTGIEKIPLSLFFFTPLIYYSIVNREVINYLIFGAFLYYLIHNYNWIINTIRLVVSFTLMYFVRPETSFSIIMLLFFYSLNSLKKSIICGLGLLSVLFVLQFFTKKYIAPIEQGQKIYFGLPQEKNSPSSIGAVLRYSDDIILKSANYIYYVFSPVPPYIFKYVNFENLFLSIGQLFWYYILYSLIRNYSNLRQFIHKEIFLANLLVLLIYVFIVAFYGGTQRHYYTCVPMVLLSFDYLLYTNKLYLIKAAKELLILTPLIIGVYFVIKLLI